MSHTHTRPARRNPLKHPSPAPQVIEALDVDQCLLFCRTNVDCDSLERFLVQVGGGQRFTGKVRPRQDHPPHPGLG